MNKNYFKLLILAFVLLSLSLFFLLYNINQPNLNIEEASKPEGLMLLIEFEDTVGINNFVYQMDERDIPGLLMVNVEYVEENCELVKGLQNYNIEIAGLYPTKPFWDMPYDSQYEIMQDTKRRIESCTGSPMRIFGSAYFAYDENTLKAADELGIEYIFARGTTGSKATIYKATEYDAKIFSVSNIDSPKWGTGSLCDYSYWAREGSPEEFREEVYKAFDNHEKVSPVSHTYIGGLKERWNDIYIDMFDNLEVDWVTLDKFGKIDIEDRYINIPENREVKYTQPKPEIPLSEEVNLNNPCVVVGLEEDIETSLVVNDDDLVVFHNGIGSMCLEALDFFKDNNLVYVEYLNTDKDFNSKLESYMSRFSLSEGVSDNFGYYPMIFYKGRAFSGFNNDIGESLISL